MGQRANLIIKEQNDYKIYYDHWVANSLDSYLFWGPETAIAWVEAHEPNGAWLDTIWCEGGAVIDLSNRHLLFFGGEDISLELPLRKLFIEMLGMNWPGWSIQWAGRGILDIAAYVGYDEEKVKGKQEEEFWEQEEVKQAFIPCSIPDTSAVVSILEHGKLSVFPSNRFTLLDSLSCGSWIFQCISKNLPSHLDLRNVIELPWVGIHFDKDNQQLLYWTTDIGYAGDTYQNYWPGWKVINLYDDYSRHLQLLGDHILLPTQNKEELFQRIEKLVCRQYKSSLTSVDELLQSIKSVDKGVEVNPFVYQTKDFFINESLQRKILAEIKERLLPDCKT